MSLNAQGDPSLAAVHDQEALKLEADGYIELFQIILSPPAHAVVNLYLSSKNTVNWQGTSWESYGVTLSDYRRDSSGELSRPKFSLFNPNGEFTRYGHQGWIDGAVIKRYRVLKEHLDANANSFLLNTWRVGRILQLSNPAIILELRSVLDGQSFVLPGRAFVPPKFPSVSI